MQFLLLRCVFVAVLSVCVADKDKLI
jgi:hypothetical protein